MHLVNTLKVKLLIDVDITTLKSIVTDLLCWVTIINSCDKIEIDLNLSFCSAQRIKLSVVCLSDVSILLFSTKTIAVWVQSDAIPSDHNFLFESDYSVEGISMFTHIVNYLMTEILVQNDISKHIVIQWNDCLRSIVKYDKEGCFLTDVINLPLAAISAQKSWFFNVKTMISALMIAVSLSTINSSVRSDKSLYTTTLNNELFTTILSNNVTIYSDVRSESVQ